jgi:serine-type D-Ala-D-Ala carboxypeptidase (penicillin-binding protein 5/6)
MRLPRILAIAAAACVAVAGLVSSQPAAAAPVATTAAITGPSGVVAAGAELINAGTGRQLWSRAPDRERPIGSITKVMTALLVLRSGHLTRQIAVTSAAEQYAQSFHPSEAGLHPGDVLTARQLLVGMLLPSGCDAAYLLATSFGPGRRAFVHRMNLVAGRLQMTRTHFANFGGLPYPTEYSTYSTPHDLMLLARAAMKYAVFRQIVAQRTHLITATTKHHRYFWTNTNLLLGSYRGAVGIKTGFTSAAGYCLLFAAVRGTHALVGVVLDSTATDPNERFTAAARMLTWGFRVLG